MIITKKKLARRSFLKGMGTIVALPMLDAMVPALGFSKAAEAKAPTRLAFAYVPNGIMMKDWLPTTTGTDFTFTRILKPFEPLREDVLILSGLDLHNGYPLGDGPGDHARAGASFLTGIHCKKTAGADIQGGISVDQAAAAKFEGVTKFASLEFGLEDSRTVGECDSGYSCAYTNSISWRTAKTPMPPEINPRAAFERMFGSEDISLDPKARALRARERKSILDSINADTSSLVKTLGPADKHKLDEYLYSIREIEQRIAVTEKQNSQISAPIDKPTGVPFEFPEYAKLMFDLLVIAFQSDLTRVSSFMIGREGSNRVYPEISIPDPHHPLTHHRNNPEWIEKVTRINALHTELFAGFLKKLKDTRDGDGSLLDHSMIVYGSGLSDGNKHDHDNLPILVAGRGNGSIKTGRHLAAPKGTPLTNLYLALLDRAGVHQDTLGDSTGRFDQIGA